MARDWLVFAEAAEETVIEFELESGVVGEPSAELVTLRELQKSWRPDLIAVRSKRLFIIAPASVPAAVARCLSMGELVCGTLEDLFAGIGELQERGERLQLILYESREEYLDKGKGDDQDADLEWTAGYFSMRESLSRLYVPSGENNS